MNKKLTLDLVKKLFNYDEVSGKIFWKVSRSPKINVGQEAGTPNGGYRIINIDRVFYKTHQIVWFLKTGKRPIHEIDHIDGDGMNNKFINLRDVPRKENHKNQSIRSTNTSGYNGISWDKSRNRWIVSVTVNGKMLKLGRYEDINEAIKIRKSVDSKYGFHKNHGRPKSVSHS